jgi:hypothetical protein
VAEGRVGGDCTLRQNVWNVQNEETGFLGLRGGINIPVSGSAEIWR